MTFSVTKRRLRVRCDHISPRAPDGNDKQTGPVNQKCSAAAQRHIFNRLLQTIFQRPVPTLTHLHKNRTQRRDGREDGGGRPRRRCLDAHLLDGDGVCRGLRAENNTTRQKQKNKTKNTISGFQPQCPPVSIPLGTEKHPRNININRQRMTNPEKIKSKGQKYATKYGKPNRTHCFFFQNFLNSLLCNAAQLEDLRKIFFQGSLMT